MERITLSDPDKSSQRRRSLIQRTSPRTNQTSVIQSARIGPRRTSEQQLITRPLNRLNQTLKHNLRRIHKRRQSITRQRLVINTLIQINIRLTRRIRPKHNRSLSPRQRTHHLRTNNRVTVIILLRIIIISPHIQHSRTLSMNKRRRISRSSRSQQRLRIRISSRNRSSSNSRRSSSSRIRHPIRSRLSLNLRNSSLNIRSSNRPRRRKHNLSRSLIIRSSIRKKRRIRSKNPRRPIPNISLISVRLINSIAIRRRSRTRSRDNHLIRVILRSNRRLLIVNCRHNSP